MRQAEDKIRDGRADDPCPREDGREVADDEAEGSFPGRECDVGDGRQHDNATNHSEWLQPEHVRTEKDAEIERTCQGTASEGDRALQPAGTGEFRVDRGFAERPSRFGEFEEFGFGFGKLGFHIYSYRG